MLVALWIVAVWVLALAAVVLLMDSTRVSRPAHPKPPMRSRRSERMSA